MAGTAVHLAVADLIVESLGIESFKSVPYFFCGNIAPDAIHARQNYVRELKKTVHLTTGISGGDFSDPHKLSVFHSRLYNFSKENLNPDNDNFDLYLGYVSHLICDELFNIHVRNEFVSAMKTEGITENDSEFFNRLMKDISVIDVEIIKKYPFKSNVRNMLESVWNYEISGLISADELNRSKRWVLDNLFCDYNPLNAKYYNYEYAEKFICFAAEEIISRLRSGQLGFTIQ